MSRIELMSYSRTKSLPNHEQERLEVRVRLEKGEHPDLAFHDAKEFVESKLGLKRLSANIGEILKTKEGKNE